MSSPFQPIDWILFLFYFLLLLGLTLWRRKQQEDDETFMIGGRRLSLFAFVATLVSTWYGGILGVGEFSFQYGISQWIVMGLPYYLFAGLFATFLAGRIREHPAISLPEAIGQTYGESTGRWSTLLIFILVNPAPYLLMLATLFHYMTGGEGPFLLYATATAFFSIVYVMVGGFNAVVRTDILQTLFMFAGFLVLLISAISEIGSPADLWRQLPELHRDPTGGQSLSYLAVWFFIALWTFVDPGFHQRAAAAKTPETARKGIALSILCWFLFDMLTLTTALYGWLLLGPDLADPVLVYPIMASELLPAGWLGLFFLTLLAVIMSTLDSYLFLSGQTIGRDLFPGENRTWNQRTRTRAGMVVAALIALLLVTIYPSVIDLWYVIGSVTIPGLLIPILGVYIPLFRCQREAARKILFGATSLSLTWLLVGTWTASGPAYSFLGIEPFYPGLLLSIGIWWNDRTRGRRIRPI
ncbi:MAG: sodium:solute symporter family protein [Balneolaceae bacterium]